MTQLHSITEGTILRQVRWARAQKEWEAVLATGDHFEAAMWLQRHGYRLRDLKAAEEQWWSLIPS